MGWESGIGNSLTKLLVSTFFGVSHLSLREESNMSEPTSSDVKPHVMQRLLDNNWILLILGIAVPGVFYMLWGLWNVINIPMVK
jgi:hypothetical protein